MEAMMKLSTNPQIMRVKGWFVILVGLAVAVHYVAVAAYDAEGVIRPPRSGRSSTFSWW